MSLLSRSKFFSQPQRFLDFSSHISVLRFYLGLHNALNPGRKINHKLFEGLSGYLVLGEIHVVRPHEARVQPEEEAQHISSRPSPPPKPALPHGGLALLVVVEKNEAHVPRQLQVQVEGQACLPSGYLLVLLLEIQQVEDGLAVLLLDSYQWRI